MTAKRYRVLDPHAKKIGGVPLNADGSVTLTDKQAKYPLDQRQIVELPNEIPPAAPVPLAAPERFPR